ncbi:winged helix-turn-helix domain-containing protein [Shewanella insulae]|uniref:tetratricopeptide repeat protein n=1 Tax=Shewanella insulae TaxID=2681496 RepID=UPI001EFDF510|nr:tetratricopeptide repeat protein [Shewanella insulae]MCG9740367.1 winged helix-turn-helix domain-containing protein [Shewanella insulae]
MHRDDSQHYLYQFGDLKLNTQLGTLEDSQGEEILLPHLSYQLLHTLCAAAPAIVSQQHLIQAVWPETVVGDETLKQRIKLLRKALGDDASQPKYIEAVRGRGYRILPPVKATPLTDKPEAAGLMLASDQLPLSNTQNYPSYWKMTSLILFIFLLLFIYVAILISSTHSLSPTQPQTAQSSGFDTELYEKGLEYYHRYREEDNRHAIDLFLSAIAINPDHALAYAGLSDAYSQGVFQFNGPEAWRQQAVDTAYKAIALNPNLAQGYKSLGLAYYNKGWLTKAIQANNRALEKQPNFSEAMSNLSYIYRETGQLQQALYWADKALKTDPKNSVSMVHRAYALIALGRYRAARESLDKALALQPDSLLANDTLGLWYLYQGNFITAREHYLRLTTQQPEQLKFVWRLAQCRLYLGEFAVSMTLGKQLAASPHPRQQQRGELIQFLADDHIEKQRLTELVEAYHQRQTQGSDRPADSFALAQIYAKSGETVLSNRYLIQAINQGWLAKALLVQHPLFIKRHQDADFKRLLAEIDQQLIRESTPR